MSPDAREQSVAWARALACGPKPRQRRKGVTWEVIALKHGLRCHYCGIWCVPGSENRSIRPSLDHVKPRSAGGTRSWANSVLACMDCNERKADRIEASLPLAG